MDYPVIEYVLYLAVSLYELGLILLWVHDRSERQRRSYELVEDTTEANVRLLVLATLPGLRARRRLLHWVSNLIEEATP